MGEMEVVTTRCGALRGRARAGHTVFYGVPYAQPPVGPLRFRPPQPPQPYAGLRDATCLPTRLWQPQAGTDTPSGREFCFAPEYLTPMEEGSLFLHIWTPAAHPDERLPVAFWIHGGAFVKGAGAEVAYDGAGFCRRGVVLVSIDYRMGAFGFLCHPRLAEEGGGHCGNYGLLDQIAALRWVRENIGAFGGDPDRITLMGQSAGAIGVQALVSSKLAQGMFRGAVMQSAGGYKSPLSIQTPQREAERRGERFAALCGAASLRALRALPPQALVAAGAALEAHMPGRLAFAPVVDGLVLSDTLDALAEAGAHADVPYLLGYTADDLHTGPGAEPSLHSCTTAWSLLNIQLGRKPAHVYRFAHVPPGGEGAYSGAYHSAELWYEFETYTKSWRPYGAADALLAGQVADYWCNFVKAGDPNGPGLPPWPPCTDETQVHVIG